MKHKPLWSYVLLAVAVFGVDRLTKLVAQTYCEMSCEINSLLSFTLVQNTGITWGLFGSDARAVAGMLTAVVIAVTTFLCVLGYRRWQRGYHIAPEALIIGGSLSNILDRLMYGGVIDFIALSYKEWSWPVFNVADIFIVVGVLLLAVKIYSHEESFV